MPSTVTEVISTRVEPETAERLREEAEMRELSLSCLLARLAREGLTRLA
jgi:hypothetical protein